MNILDYFENKMSNEQLQNQSTNRKITDFINDLIRNDIINLKEYQILLDFIKNNGSITEYHKLKKILEKLSNNKQKDYCINQEGLDNLISIFDNYQDYDNSLETMQTENKINNIVFTIDQLNALENIFNFLKDDEQYMYLLCGYAGSGKTTIVAKLIHYLVVHNYIKKVAMTAPTNQAVNVLKNKFKENISELVSAKILNNNTVNMNDQLNILEKAGIKINFLTIHKLLSYKSDINHEGKQIFTKSGKSSIDHYNLIIIDECSMISKDVIDNTYKEIKKIKDLGSIYPKIIFVGDPAQLPPVNEKVSSVFDKNINMSILKEIVRTSDNNVIGICNDIRNWVLDDKHLPKMVPYKSKKVYLTNKQNRNKIETNWFKRVLSYHKKEKPSIILTWTNKQTNIYNDKIREALFGNNLPSFIEGETLVFRDYYNFKDENDNKFYASEQVRVNEVDVVHKVIKRLSDNFDIKIKSKIKKEILNLVSRCIKNINTNTAKSYDVWKLIITKVLNINNNNVKSNIYVINNLNEYKKDKDYIAREMGKLSDNIFVDYDFERNYINNNILKPVWKEIHGNFFEPFADVRYGYSITTHSGQGTNYYNVFVDMDDITKNKNKNEMKRCLYTALTRTSNEVHIIV
jgi:hypothetical protein